MYERIELEDLGTHDCVCGTPIPDDVECALCDSCDAEAHADSVPSDKYVNFSTKYRGYTVAESLNFVTISKDFERLDTAPTFGGAFRLIDTWLDAK